MLQGSLRVSAQTHYIFGQNAAPVFEGWERNADGTFNMVFGYMNRNYEEELDIPVGPNNSLEPGGVDQGQPTHFYARRQQFVFKVKVAKDWGKKDLVWTLNVRGKIEKAYATMLPFWELGNLVYQENRGGPGEITDEDEPNAAPSITLLGPSQLTAAVGQTLALTAAVTDDGHPAPRVAAAGAGRGRQSAPIQRDSDGGGPPGPGGGGGGELHLPCGAGAEDASEVGRERRPVRHVEIGAVEQVEDLPPQLEPRPVWAARRSSAAPRRRPRSRAPAPCFGPSSRT